MKKQIRIRVNGLDRDLEVSTRATLLDAVRDQLGLTAAKLGCEMQVCGACTLLVNGKPVSSCSYLAVDADGAEILTTEGLEHNGQLHPLQEAFMQTGALQCGYCTSGFLLTAKAMLDENPHPSEEYIREYLGGNLCRCGCYGEIMQAVKKAAGL
jgi:aerobic-type carbon monoxide dehydrogenase small subunit (CoxS/CutS family)